MIWNSPTPLSRLITAECEYQTFKFINMMK